MKEPRIRILFVEDDPEEAEAVRDELTDGNAPLYEWTAAESLTDGIEAARRPWTDVVLLDLGLPDSQRIETLHRMQERLPNVPIIVLTEPGEPSLGIQLVREGSLDYLVKGQIDWHLLARTLRYAFEREQLLSTLERQTRELQTSERRFRKIVQEKSDGIVLLDRERRVLLANPAAETLLGKKSGSLIIAKIVASGVGNVRFSVGRNGKGYWKDYTRKLHEIKRVLSRICGLVSWSK